MIELDFIEKKIDGTELWHILKDGMVIGLLSVIFIPPDTIAVKNVEVRSGPGSIGIGGIRGLQEAIKREYPTVTKVIGQRISGVRTPRASELLVVEQTI